MFLVGNLLLFFAIKMIKILDVKILSPTTKDAPVPMSIIAEPTGKSLKKLFRSFFSQINP